MPKFEITPTGPAGVISNFGMIYAYGSTSVTVNGGSVGNNNVFSAFAAAGGGATVATNDLTGITLSNNQLVVGAAGIYQITFGYMPATTTASSTGGTPQTVNYDFALIINGTNGTAPAAPPQYQRSGTS